MDLSKLSDADLQALSVGDLTKLSDEGLGILAGVQAPQPQEDSLLVKGLKGAVGAEGALADFLAPVNMVAGGLHGLGKLITGQGLDEAVKATQDYEDLKPTNLLQRFTGADKSWFNNPGADVINAVPEKIGELGQFVGDKTFDATGSPLAGTLANVGTGLAAFGGLAKGVKSIPPFTKAKETVKPVTPKQDQAPNEKSIEQPVFKEQGELDLGQPNQFGHRPSDFVVDENGIPIRRNASLEAQETVRQGDLFSMDNQATELANDIRNRMEPQFEEGYPANREYLKQQEIEQAYLDKAKQDSLPLEESIAEPTQRSSGMTGFGKGQRGAINPEVFQEGFQKVKDIVTKGLEDIKLMAYSDNGKLNVAAVEGDRPVALVEFSPKGENIESNYININDQNFRGKGLSEEMYKFASELGNDVKASDVQTEGGRKMWDKFQQNGTATGQRMIAKGQRGSIGFFSDKENKANVVKNISPRLKDALSAYKDVDSNTALDAIKNTQDASESGQGYIRSNLLARGRLGFEKIKNDGVKAGLAHIVGLKDQARINANTVLHGENGILRNFRKVEKLFNPGEAAEVFRQRLEAQFNPDYKFNLNERQMKLNDQMNKLFADYKAKFEEKLGKPLHEVPNYFPSMFYGDFASKIMDADGRLIAWVTENSAKDLKDAIAHVLGDLGEGFSAGDPIYRKDIKKTGFQGKTGLAEYFDSMLELLTSDDPLVQKAQQSVQNVVNKRAFQTRQTQNRFKFKSGVMGAEGTKSWKSMSENYYANKQVLENFVRGAEEWLSNMDTAKFLDDVKNEAPESVNTYNTLQSYFDDIRGTNVDSNARGIFHDLDVATANATLKGGVTGNAAQALRSALGVNTARKTANILVKNWLGLWNPTAMAQNVLQPVRTVSKLVDLAAQGGSKDVISPMILGFMDSLADGVSFAAGKVNDKFISDNLKFQLRNEVVKPSLIEAEGKTKGGHFGEKFLVSGGMLSTEAFARSTTFNIFKRYLENSGYEGKQALDLAKNLTHDYQVNYENYARAGLINKTGAVGEMAGRLQSFKINELTQLANYIETMKDTKNPLPLATALSVSIAMAGISGMIGMDIAEGIYGLLVKAGLVDPKTRSPRQMALDLGGSLAYGVPTEATGKWLSGSLTTNIVGDTSWRNVAPVFAGIVDTASKLPIAAKWIKNSDAVPNYEKAQVMEAVSPTVLRGVIENKYLTDKEGRVSSQYTGKPVYKNGEQDTGFLSSTNLRSKERGETQLRASLLKNQEANISDRVDSKIKNLQGLIDDSVRMGRKVDSDHIASQINDIVNLGGDPQVMVKKIVDFVVSNHLDNWFQQQVMRGNINLGNAQRKVRALDEQQRMSQ